MSYFEELLETSIDSNQLRFNYNANSGGGQAFLAGKFIDSNGVKQPLELLEDREATLAVRYDISRHESREIRLEDSKCRYSIKPRGQDDRNMKFQIRGPGVDKINPSRAVSAFFMLPSTTTINSPRDLKLSMLTTGNYWLSTMPMRYKPDPSGNNRVVFETNDLIFSGGVDKAKNGEKRTFRLDCDRRVSDVIELGSGKYFADDINEVLAEFAAIYQNDSQFNLSRCATLTDQLMAATAREYPQLYSGISDALPVLKHVSKGSLDATSSPLRFVTGLETEFSYNVIWFGAPGTGKSFSLNRRMNQLISRDGRYERITFHQDYSYGSFVGTYKPVPIVDGEGRESISYRFVPGPFLRLLVAALHNGATNKPVPHVLVVEEINRANASAVFGEAFQLLDRSVDGCSEYGIHPSEDIRQFLSTELGLPLESLAELKIPDNMYIWATMNSADQGVYPLDTAFKRRWDFEYIGINDFESAFVGKCVRVGDGDFEGQIEWNLLRRAINDFLASQGINEDKQLGPYFLGDIGLGNDGESISSEKFVAKFKTKVLMYLFEDAARSIRSRIFSGAGNSTLRYSDLCDEFDRVGLAVFNQQIADMASSADSLI